MRDAYREAARTDRRRAQGFAASPPRDVLRMGIDVGLFAAIFVLPFVMGGRQAIGEMAFTLIACWTAAAWSLRQMMSGDGRLRLTGMTPLLLIGIAIVSLQVVAMSPQWLGQLSPHIADLLPAWSAESMRGIFTDDWSTISLVPYETQRSLVCVVAGAMLFVVAVNRLQTLDDVRQLIRALAVAMTLMAVFGSVQFVAGNGLFFGVYDHPFTNTRDYAKGAFTNPNHFADYVAMALPLLLAWFAMHSRSERPGRFHGVEGLFIVTCLGCVSLGVLLSQSRGGLLAACIGVMVCLFVLHRVQALNGRTAGVLGAIACGALLSLTLFGDRIVALVDANFHEIASADVRQLDRGNSRQKIWQAAVAGMRDFPLFGTGLSSHREVYWTYFDQPDDGMEFSHAENGYLNLGLETGLAGLATLGCCLLLWIGWCVSGLRRSTSVEARTLLAAILGVIAITLSHSVTDFVWYAPAIVVVLLLLAAASAALQRLAVSRPRNNPQDAPSGFRPVWGIGFAGMLLLSGWMVQVKLPAVAAEPYWFDFVHLVQEESRLNDEKEIAAHNRQKYAALLNAARADRYDARIQMRAARAYELLFGMKQQQSENPMSLLQIQDAALASEWSSPDELTEWLNRPGVIGANRKYLDTAWDRAIHALALCPLQSEGYLLLSELAWIYGPQTEVENQLLAEALTVRPFDPEVHFVTGRVVSLRGNEEAALKHWKESFDRSPRFRDQITSLLSPVWPAQKFIEVFDPETDALVPVVAAYRTSPDVDGFRQIAARLAGELSTQAGELHYTEASQRWRQACDLYIELGDKAGADRAAHAAVEADANNFQARRNLGKWLFSQEEYTNAVEHLEWCKRRSPTDQEVSGWLHAAIARQPGSPIETVTPASYSTRR